MIDIADGIQIALYGRSGRASANAGNEEFLAGFEVGRNRPLDCCGLDDIDDEWERRGSPLRGDDRRAFREWRRGYWAARLQMVFAVPPPGMV